MCSFSVDNSANIHAAVDLFYRFWLVDRKSLHQPYELLTGEISDLLLVAGPAEPSAFKSFVEPAESRHPPKAMLSDGLFFVRRTGTDYLKTGPVCAAAER